MNDNPQPAAPPPAPVYAAPPSASQQYTDTMQWNIDNAGKVLATQQQYDPQFASLQQQIQAQTSAANLQSYTDQFDQFGAKLAADEQQFALNADPLGQTRQDYITSQVNAPVDNEINDQYRALLDKGPAIDTSLLSQLRGIASSRLSDSGKLSADNAQMLEEQSRGADSARGLAYSPASAYKELLNKDQFVEGRQQIAFQNAENVVGLSQAADTANLSANMSLLSALQGSKLQGVSSRAALLGLSQPVNVTQSAAAFGQGYQPTNFNSTLNTTANIGATSAINNSIANFNASLFGTQTQGAASMYGSYQTNLSKNSTLGQLGQGLDLAGGVAGSVMGGMMF